MEKKQALKRIRQCIDAENVNEAHSLIQELLPGNEDDYMLCIFAAIVSSKKNDSEAAIEFYQKALRIDDAKPVAWQGIAELYRTHQINANEFILKALDKLNVLYKDTPDKQKIYTELRDQALVDLQCYEILLHEERFLSDSDLCKRIVNAIVRPDHIYSEHELTLCKKCVDKLKGELPENGIDTEINEELASKCAIFQASITESLDELNELVIAEASRYIRRYGASEHEQQGDSSAEPTQLQSQRQQWLQKSLSDLIATNSLIKRCVDEKLLVMLRSVSTTESDCFETLLQFICERRFDAGFELIQTLNAQQLKWPFSAPLIIVYLNLEQYERLLETVDSALLTEKHLALARITDEFLLTAKAEALYGIADPSSLQSFDQLMNSEHFRNEIWTFLHLSKLAKSDCSNDEFVKELDEAKVDGDERYCWMAAKALSNNQRDGAGINAKKALSGQLTSWRVMLLLAEVLLRLDPNDPHATSLLLKVIKQNGPSSRIYYRLAQSLAERSRSKALGCLEMALKIRPQYLEVVQLRDRLLALEQRKEEQLKNVERFIGVQPRCVWALRRCALLKLQLNMIDEAIDELQYALRITSVDEGNESDRVILLNALAIAYGKRGNFESAIKTLRTLIELKPNDATLQIQLIQMYRTNGQLEEALEGCESIQQARSTTSIIIPPSQKSLLITLHCDLLIRMARTQSSTSKVLSLVNRFFELLQTQPENVPLGPALLKSVGDAMLLLASSFGEHIMTTKLIHFPQSWPPISTRDDALRIAVDAYFALAKLRPCTETWNDLGLGLLRRAQLKNADKALAKRAVVCFKRALSMCSHKSTQCSLWINIAQATLLIGSKLTALHCIKVALLINANNSVAWSLLAILLLICKKHESCERAVDMALKENAKLAEVWTVQALLREQLKQPSAFDSFAQSISLKPTRLAIEKYTYHLMNALRCNKNNGEGNASTSTTTNLFNFDSVNDLIEMGDMDEKFLLFVALLAERMGFYKHSFKYIQLYCKCGNNGDTLNNIHYQRIAIRSKSAEINNCVEQLKAFAKLCALEKTQLYDELVKYSKLYSELFDILNENALERMRAFLAQNDSRLSTVLIVSMLICFEKTLSNEMIKLLRHMCIQHPILSLYPPGAQPDSNDEFAYDIGDKKGDSIVSPCQNHYTESLYQLLQLRREVAAEEMPSENNDPAVLEGENDNEN